MLPRVVRTPSGGEQDPIGIARADPVEVLLTSGDVRKKALSGVLLVVMRTFAVRGLGFVGSLVLARLLTPANFGVLAFGQTLMFFGAFFADAGIAAGLIRRNQAPTRRELQTILGFQVLAASLIVVVVALVAAPSGRNGQVVTVMTASVILSACRTPASLVLERRLDYRAIASVEVIEGLIFVIWSVAAVALGAGVWGVATAHIARAAGGSALMISRSPIKVFSPRLQVGIIRELVGYGLVVQAGGLVDLVRGQIINLTTAAVAGLPVLGLYSLADRVMQLPWLVFDSLLRVAFPAMARLIGAGEDARADLERGLRLLTVFAGALLCLVGATAPVLIPSVFGGQWQPAVGALPLIALGLLIAGPVIAVGNGYLYAVGDARKVLTANIAHSLAWIPVAVPLLPAFGATAVGAGLLAGFTVEGFFLARAVRARTGLRCYRITAAPSLSLIGAGAVGFVVALRLEPTLLSTLAVAALTGVLLSIGLLLTAWPTLVDAVRLVRRVAAGRSE